MSYPFLPARTQFWNRPSPSRPRGFRLARVFGIDILIDLSWFMIIVLVVLSIHTQFAIYYEDGVSSAELWVAAIVEGLLFFGSVLLHELSHSLVARRLGVGVHSITLFIFGGISSLDEEPTRAQDELLISGAGPIASFAIGVLAGIVAMLLPAGTFPRYFFHWLSVTNFVLALFNLLPGFPLDGGRVLRAAVWKATGNMARGTRVASLAGTAIAYGLMMLGVLLFLFNGGIINGLWFILIGWFLLNAAQSGLVDLKVRRILMHHAVRQVLRSDCPRVPGSTSLEEFVDRYLLRSGERCFFVTEGDALTGLLNLRDLNAVPRERWAETQVRNVMTPVDRVRRLSVNDTLLAAMEALNRERVQQMPVVDEGKLVGVITRDSLIRVVELDRELDHTAAES
jgi:Zn-dependent protease